MYARRQSWLGRSLALLFLLIAIQPSVARAQGTPPTAASPGTAVWANFDFVPGERVLFAEDFTRDRVGNFPKRLELVNGNMEVVEWQSKRWLRNCARPMQ